MEIRKLAEQLRALKDEETALIKREKEVKKEATALKYSIIEALTNMGVTSIKFPGVGLIYLSTRKNPTLINKEKYFKYLRDSDQGEMIQETVHSSTFRGWFNQQPDDEEIDYDAMGVEFTENVIVTMK